MNSVCLIGRLTKPPEKREGKSGKPFATFSLAVPQGFKRDQTGFFNCVAFGEQVSALAVQGKGQEIGVMGALQQRKFTAKDGTEKESVEVVVERAWVLGSRSRDGASTNASNASSRDDDDPFGDD